MANDALVRAAGRIADGEVVDWQSISSTLGSDAEREVADELAVISRIAAGHRQLHEILPVAPDTPSNLMPDRAKWGHLDLLNIVGRGSYGTVYRAWDTRLERLVALKLFHGAHDPEVVMQEGRMLARVRHEHVVTVYGADVIDGVAGLWMELIHGRTLDQIVKDKGPMDPREAAQIGVDVSRAIAAVHAAGLLHCDVKAQNVVRENTGRVVLMDLGAGRVVPEARDSDQLSDIAGTPRYMAPELFHAGADATRATDIYSFGVLLFYLVSERFPVDGKSLGELKQAHLEGKVTPLKEVRANVPPAYAAVVARALDRDPARRQASVVEIQSALAPIAAQKAKGLTPKSIGLLAAVAVAVGALAFTLWSRPGAAPVTTPGAEIRSIAVLPIKNLTGDPSKAYIADGLTELLISNLARVRLLRVPSFAAVAPMRDTSEAPAETIKRLGVQILLAGSITQANDQVRLTVHLVNAQGVAMWGDEVTRDLAGVMAAQADITRRIAQELALDLGDAARPAVQARMDPRAQSAYLRGLALRVASPSTQEDAARTFREAVEIEPGLADGWAQLSLIESLFAERLVTADRDQSRRVAKEMADRAINLDPNGPNGYAALGTIQFYSDWDFPAAERSLRRATELAPSAAFPRQRLSMLLAALGRFDEAASEAKASQQLEPTVAIRSTTLGTVYYYAGDFQKAAEAMRLALAVTPDFGVAHFGLGRIASASGKQDQAIAEIERALAQSRNSGWLVELARVYAAAGRPDDVRRVLNELTDRDRAGDHYSPDNLAYIAAAEGRKDEAFRILDDAVDHRVASMLWIAVDPRVDSLRSDPRFAQMLRRMKLRP